jgi:membrane protease YdiL (CAAX protease family)
MENRTRIILKSLEFLLLFAGIPLFMFLDTGFSLPSIVLVPSLIFIFIILRYRTGFRWKELVYMKIPGKQLIRDAIILLACGVVLLAAVLVWSPSELFNLPRGNPVIWLALSVFYPVFSAYPQEIIFRTYVFRRYPDLFRSNRLMVAASGISFGFAHIVYYHPVSMILTLIGGIYLAGVYSRTGSVLYTAILHGILGVLVFTLGLGEYFWLEMNEYLG